MVIKMIIGFLIGASGGVFIGIGIMALFVASSHDSRAEENDMIDDGT